ncbi:MAG: hypothetical protein R3D56_03975 [Paracoccaceae bacterium]
MKKGLRWPAYSKDMQEDKEQVFRRRHLDACPCGDGGHGPGHDCQPRQSGACRLLAASTATDLADWLVRALGLPFREAHHVTGSLVAHGRKERLRPARSEPEMNSVHAGITQEIYSVLGVRNSVASRQSHGGTAAPSQVRAQIARWKGQLG